MDQRRSALEQAHVDQLRGGHPREGVDATHEALLGRGRGAGGREGAPRDATESGDGGDRGGRRGRR